MNSPLSYSSSIGNIENPTTGPEGIILTIITDQSSNIRKDSKILLSYMCSIWVI